MPGLLSGSMLRTGGSGQFIKLQDAMPQLPASPSTSTGYTVVTTDKLITTYASSLGNIQFTTGTMYLNVTGTNLRLVGTETLSVIVSGGSISTNTNTGALVVEGGVGIWGNAFIGGNLVTSIFTATTSTVYSLAVTSTATSVNTSTGALVVEGGVGIGENLNVKNNLTVGSTATFSTDVNITRDTNITGELNVTGIRSVNISPSAASVTIEPTLGGTITIQPSATGHMNDMIVGEYRPQNSYFLDSHATNFIGLATTSTNINGGQLGSIPYQTAACSTSFISIGNTSTVLTSNGTTATWESSANLSVSTATYADNIFVNTSTEILYHIILSTATNAYGKVVEDTHLTYDANVRQLSVPSVTASGSIYSQDGIAEEDNLLYTPRTSISLDTPPDNSPRLGDFWIDPGQGATFEYILDGVNKIWLQFTGL